MDATNPFGQELPVRVLLRNRTIAHVSALVEDRPPFCLLGALGEPVSPPHLVAIDGEPLLDRQLWRHDGRWREDGQRCLLDIVGVVVGQLGSHYQVTAFAPAAGATGPAPGGPV